MKTVQPKFIVGIGGSAGALNAYKALLEAMSHDTGMAFVIISHMMPTAHSQLTRILSRHTEMSVLLASDGMSILANHVYIMPPNTDITVENYKLKLITPRIGRNKQVDLFFISLAEAMGVRAVGIILSGYDGDGTLGCQHIRAKGGKIFTQDSSAEVGHMPLSAQAAGCVDFVLPVDEIPAKLISLTATLKI